MDPVSSFRFFEPNLTVFACERCCASVALDLMDSGNRCHLVPGCAGDVSGQRIGEAFAEGADGVLILGCVGRTCQAPLGEVEAFRHIHEGAMALHRLGLDPARLQRSWVTPREASRVPALIIAYRRRLAALGPRRALSATASPACGEPVGASAGD